MAKETEAKSCTVFVEFLTFDRIGKGEENSFDSHCFGEGGRKAVNFRPRPCHSPFASRIGYDGEGNERMRVGFI